jgi:hypothetical protein
MLRCTWGAEEFDDFRGEMWLGVHEGAFLFEFPGGSILHTSDGVERHGPWPPDECSRCLLTWFDHGWINACVLSEQLYRWSHDHDGLLSDPDDETPRLLEHDRARAILADPQTWTNDSAEGFVILNPSDHAPSSDFRQLWLDSTAPRS